jgi:hypothetical protein
MKIITERAEREIRSALEESRKLAQHLERIAKDPKLTGDAKTVGDACLCALVALNVGSEFVEIKIEARS